MKRVPKPKEILFKESVPCIGQHSIREFLKKTVDYVLHIPLVVFAFIIFQSPTHSNTKCFLRCFISVDLDFKT